MSGEAMFWIFIVVFCLLMLVGFVLLDRPTKGRGIPTKLSVDTDPKEPRGRHLPADRVDPRETDSRL